MSNLSRGTWALGLAACLAAAACNPQPGDGAAGRHQAALDRDGRHRAASTTRTAAGIAKIISENLEGRRGDGRSDRGLGRQPQVPPRRPLGHRLQHGRHRRRCGARRRGRSRRSGTVPTRALAVLYSNYLHLVTRTDTGIAKVADLKGRVVSTGAPGSGTEVVAFRVLEALGLNPKADLTTQALGATQSVDALKDAKLDAFFFTGGLPTAAVLDLTHTPGIKAKLIPSDDALPKMRAQYGESLYYPVVIPEDDLRHGRGRDGRRHRQPARRVRDHARAARVRHHAAAVREAGRARRDPPAGARSVARDGAQGSPVPFHPAPSSTTPKRTPGSRRSPRRHDARVPGWRSAHARRHRGDRERGPGAPCQRLDRRSSPTASRSSLSLYSLYWVVAIVQPQIYRVSFLLVSLVLIFLLFREPPVEHAGQRDRLDPRRL